jgi:hypothetical protein
MTALEQITQMKNQGISDEEIVSNLQQQGIPPQEIQDALSQAQVKNAVMGGEMGQAPAPRDQAPQTSEQYTPQVQDMGNYPQPTEYDQSQQTPQAGGQEGYDQGYYSQAPADYGPAGTDTETMIEVAGQVFAEKSQKTQKKVDLINEFRALSEIKIENLENRLKRIESIIDKMQIDILEKVGAYGKGLSGAKKEITMMQNSMKKIAGKPRKHTTHKKTTSRKRKSKKKK